MQGEPKSLDLKRLRELATQSLISSSESFEWITLVRSELLALLDRLEKAEKERDRLKRECEVLRQGLRSSRCDSRFSTVYVHDDENCLKCHVLAQADRIREGK